MGSFYQQIAFELGDGIDHVHGHLSGGACEIDAAQCETMHTDAYFFELCDGGADVDSVAAHSPMSWAHINMLGEYDFSEEKLKDTLVILPPKKAA